MGTKPRVSNLDESTLVRWVKEYASGIRGYVTSLLHDAGLAEDFVQEVFLRAWRQRESYVEQGQAKAFLFRIADRLVIDHRRAKYGREPDSRIALIDLVDSAGLTSIDEVISRESARRIAEGLETLSPIQQRVLLLRYFGELRFEEIATMVGCPLNTALSHARRGLEQLRVHWDSQERVGPGRVTQENKS
jgi:RNA polymerase sigma-70 factor, ECF subfamily